MLKARQGFTLIELLIVVVIIGILAAIAIPKFSATRERAFVSSMKADLRNLATQQDIYYADTYEYTTSLADLEFSESEGVTVTVEDATSGGWSATATHDGLLDRTIGCAVYHGDVPVPTTLGGDSPANPGVIFCDPL
jgi:type IV pilus assembly protein PilA